MVDLSPGTVFAGHRIESVAGRGGMGIVYRATHLALDHEVALKVISGKLAGDPRFQRRFADECRHAVTLRHPNIVQIHHAGEEDGLLFVTMDLIEGTDLRVILNRDGEFAVEDAVRVAGGVAAALDAAHAQGVIHRDVKPGNVMIEPREEGEQVYLTDFGLARHVEATSGVTATGAFVGTLDYVAPEQIMGERVDARADVYSLACVLYELITGNPPFAAREDKVEKMYAHLRDEPPRLRLLRPDVPGELDFAVSRALSKDPDQRFPSAGDLARAAEASLEGSATVVAERVVATGAAAPADDEPSTALQQDGEPPPSDSEPPADLPPPPDEPPTPPDEPPTPPDEPPTPPVDAGQPADRGGTRRLIPWIVGLAGAVVIAALLFGGGDDAPEAPPATAPPAEEPAADPVVLAVPGLPVELTPSTQGIWVTSRTAGTVTLVETQFGTGDVTRSVDVGGAPEGIAAADGQLFVALGDAGEVVEVAEASGSVEETLDGFATPQGVISADGSIWVTDFGADELIEIDPTSADVVGQTRVGDSPYGIAASGEAIWVTNRADGTVSRVGLGDGEVTTSEELGDNPKGIAVTDGSVWVAVTDSNEIAQLNPAGELVTTIPVAEGPRGVVAAFGSVWVSSTAGVLTEIDPESAEALREIQLDPGLEGITADDKSIWVANGEADTVTRIDPGA